MLTGQRSLQDRVGVFICEVFGIAVLCCWHGVSRRCRLACKSEMTQTSSVRRSYEASHNENAVVRNGKFLTEYTEISEQLRG